VERHAGTFYDQRSYNVSYDGDLENYKSRRTKERGKSGLTGTLLRQADLGRNLYKRWIMPMNLVKNIEGDENA
jgi:hypothetical protein